jgi:antitoxin (DNA-binding transcriptional repressor) of toxin-antitoxin stability system
VTIDFAQRGSGPPCLTHDTLIDVKTVTVRELRNNGGEVIDRVLGGETVVVIRDGHEVAELRPLRPRPLDAATLVSRWRHLPVVDPSRFRHDVDSARDAWL